MIPRWRRDLQQALDALAAVLVFLFVGGLLFVALPILLVLTIAEAVVP